VGNPPEVEPRKEFVQSLRTPQVGREDLRGEAHGLRIGCTTKITDSRLLHGQRTRSRQDLPLGQCSIPDHDSSPRLVLEAAVATDELIDFDLQGALEHSTCSLTDQLVDLRSRVHSFDFFR
jgi:hypothetical protein